MNAWSLSVLMAVHNEESCVGKAIDSILGQTFGDFEFIIVNDGSIDGTREILEQYAKQDQRIHLIHNQQNLRLAASLNRGIETVRYHLSPAWMQTILQCQNALKSRWLF